MRLFVAVPMPPDRAALVAAATAPLREALPRLKWVEPANYHFTLNFLGDTEPGLLPALEEELAIGMEPARPFELALGAALLLPHPSKAWVMALGVERGERALVGLSNGVRSACRTLGYRVERRPFLPHLTLARAQRGRILPRLPAEMIPGDSGLAWRVTEVVLYESHLRPSGPEYDPLVRFGLGEPTSSGA